MDIDTSRKPSVMPPVCFRCSKPGHYAKDCPRAFNIRVMSKEERIQLLEDLLTVEDVNAAQEAFAGEVVEVDELPGVGGEQEKEDFVKGSG